MRQVAQQIDDPSVCIVRIRKGERIRGKLAELLNPIDPATLHEYRLPANADVELHYHDVDEYWLFTSGRPAVTLRSASGVKKEFTLEPGDMVACVRSVEHTLRADHELVYFQFSSVPQGGERSGHLTRQ
jgi:mannose-6-phosphate isomerase-like protein (cupin superfamily)